MRAWLRAHRIVVWGVALLVLAVAVFVIVLFARYRPVELGKGGAAGDPARGAYVAVAADCAACHTLGGKADFAGGLPLKSPFGAIYATNITPSRSAGIGDYTLAQFADAVRNGVRRDGAHLYPAMPYPSYAAMTDQDMRDLYAYFMRSVKPVDVRAPETRLAFPFNQRWGIALWNRAFVHTTPVTASDDAMLARGAYLVEGPGHCGSCHTPRGIMMQERAMRGGRGEAYLSGATLGGWPVPGLRAGQGGGEGRGGIAAWSAQEIVDYLRTGRNARTAVAGEMTTVVQRSTSLMTDADLAAIAAYLKSLPARPRPGRPAAPGGNTEQVLTSATGLSPGQRLYLDNCAACHFVTGKGAESVFPALSGNQTATADDPDGLIAVILNGATMPSTPGRPAQLAMPDFGWRLTDRQIADLATFVRSGWDNRAGPVSEAQVRKVRRRTPPPAISARPPELAAPKR